MIFNGVATAAEVVGVVAVLLSEAEFTVVEATFEFVDFDENHYQILLQ